jgi:adenylylsulfate kinase
VTTNSSSGCVVWLTGRPSSGKSTLAKRVAQALRARHRETCVLDGDSVRKALVPPPSYDEAGRQAFYTSLANLAGLLADQGLVVVVPATAHRRRYREHARTVATRFIEVHVDAPPEEAERRDSKGLYAAAREGRVHDVPGADLPYEAPEAADLRTTGGKDPEAVEQILALLQ